MKNTKFCCLAVDIPISLFADGFKVLHAKYANGLRHITYVSDMQTVSAQFLIANIDQAFLAWKSPYSHDLNFADFCEYILPSRVATELITDVPDLLSVYAVCISA
jgi:hypothetical protein